MRLSLRLMTLCRETFPNFLRKLRLCLMSDSSLVPLLRLPSLPASAELSGEALAAMGAGCWGKASSSSESFSKREARRFLCSLARRRAN